MTFMRIGKHNKAGFGARLLFLSVLATLLVILLAGCSLPALPGLGGADVTAVPTIDLVLPAKGATQRATPNAIHSPTPGATVAAAITPAGSSQGLPPTAGAPGAEDAPTILAVDPPAGAVVLPGHAITFYFNRPMQADVTQSVLQMQPSLPGKVAWVDDTTLRFTPDGMVTEDTPVQVALSGAVRSKAGKPLASAWQAQFTFSGGGKWAARIPSLDAKEVDPSLPIILSFDAAANDPDKNQLPIPFLLEPAAQGSGEWLDAHTYRFSPQPALASDTEYRVTVNGDALRAAGMTLNPAIPSVWTFRTAALRLLSTQPDPKGWLAPEGTIQLKFNQPMDRASLEGNLLFSDAKGKPVVEKVSWNERGDEATLHPASGLDRGNGYLLFILASAQAANGASLGQDQTLRFNTAPALALTQTQPRERGVLEVKQGVGTLTLTFNAPLKAQQPWADLITADPPLQSPMFHLNAAGDALQVRAHFKPATAYALALRPEVHDRWDGTLGQIAYYNFSTSGEPPDLWLNGLPKDGILAVLPGAVDLSARSTNIYRLELARGKLSIQDFIRAAAAFQTGTADIPTPDEKWVKLIYTASNTPEGISLSLSAAGQPLPGGLYAYQVKPTLLPGQAAMPAQGAIGVIVSGVQVTVKASARQVFAFVVQLSNTQPLPDALVTFYDADFNLLATCSTDAHGVCQADLQTPLAAQQAVFAVIAQPGDANFGLGSNAWAAEEKPSSTPLSISPDRDFYAAGQTVHLTAVNFASSTEVALNLVAVPPTADPSKPVGSLKLTFAGQNVTSADFALPADLPPGTYAWQRADDSALLAVIRVIPAGAAQVEVSAAFTQPHQRIGEDLSAGVALRYAFGVPAGYEKTQWRLFAEPISDQTSGKIAAEVWQGAAPSPADAVLLMQGAARADGQGHIALVFAGKDLKSLLAADQTYRLTLEVSAVDAAGMENVAHSLAVLHPSQLVIHLQPESALGVAGKEVFYAVRSQDWQGVPVGGQAFSARFRKVIWTQSADLSGALTNTPQFLDAGSTDFQTSDQGEARLSFLPPDPGTYLLEITEKGRSAEQGGAVSEHLLWVSGAGDATWAGLADLPIQADLSSYAAGQSVNLLIPNPFGSPAVALITLERDQVVRFTVVPVSGSNQLVKLPLVDADAPRVKVSVTLVGQQNGHPAQRTGQITLAVQSASAAVQLNLQTQPAGAIPGEGITLRLQLMGADGKPLQGTGSLAVVSAEALLLPDAAPRLGDIPSTESVFRQSGRAEEAAYWNGSLATDAQGMAQVQVKLPTLPTQWIVRAQMVTADGRIAVAWRTLAPQAQGWIRPLTPQIVTAGQPRELAAWLCNPTGSAQQVKVSLLTVGFALKEGQPAQVTVGVAARTCRVVAWEGVAQNAPAVQATFIAQADAWSQTVSPEGGQILITP